MRNRVCECARASVSTAVAADYARVSNTSARAPFIGASYRVPAAMSAREDVERKGTSKSDSVNVFVVDRNHRETYYCPFHTYLAARVL